MNIFIYSDESGVFDKIHNKIFVYGGIIFLDKDGKDNATRKYIALEKELLKSGKYKGTDELKASILSNKDKLRLFKLLNQYYKFGLVIKQKEVNDESFGNKKIKQRYLDYAYKIAVKKLFQELIKRNIINSNEVEHLYFYIDEHTTATNGIYELKETLEQEFKHGVSNFEKNTYFPPIFKDLKSVEVSFCNSSSTTLIRSADIIANHIYYMAKVNKLNSLNDINMVITKEPYHKIISNFTDK